MDPHLWLVGMMGSGKTAVGERVARRIGAPFVDTDGEVASRTGCTVAQLWGERGEKAFRAMESAAVGRIATGPPVVVATGGGAVLDDQNREVMAATGRVVWLSASPTALAARVGDAAGRPLLEDGATAERMEELLTRRRPLYESVADLTVDTTSDDVDVVVTRIEAWWRRF